MAIKEHFVQRMEALQPGVNENSGLLAASKADNGEEKLSFKNR